MGNWVTMAAFEALCNQWLNGECDDEEFVAFGNIFWRYYENP
jgi:hypothetical protein